jgi:hypothetical protein
VSQIAETEAAPVAAPTAWLNPELVQLATQPDTTPPAELSEPPAATQRPAPPVRWYNNRKSRTAVIAGIVFAVAVLSGVGGAYLRTHSLVPVQLANLRSTHSVNSPQLASQLTRAAAAYRLSLQTPDGKRTTYTLADMGLTPDIAGSLAAVKGQHGIAFWHPAHIPLKLKTNQATYVAFLRAHTAQATQAAIDANLSLSGGKVAVSSEAPGRGYRVSNAPASVLAVASNLNPSPLLLTPGAITPYIKATALQPDRTLLDKVLAQKIEITIAGDTITPSASDIANWLSLTPDYPKGTVDIAVNRRAVQQYIDDLTAPYIKAPADTVTASGGDGTVIITEQRGGGSVRDEATLVADLADRLLGAQGQKIAIDISGNNVHAVTAYAQPKWLLVNLTTKRMYAYEDTTLVRSFLVSAGAYGTPTVQGSYKIYAKYASQDMRGANADGTNYFQSNVQYVNYFYKDYAVHGNYWRPLSYFGNINSSHGCIGVVNSDAKWIYSWAPIGTTVMVHA